MNRRTVALRGRLMIVGLLCFCAAISAQAGTTPPDAVVDFTAVMSSTPTQLLLSWTSTGDDGSSGTLVAGSSYTIQYTTETSFSLWSATDTQPGYVYRTIIATSGVNPSSLQSYPLNGLNPSFTYRLRLWTSDEAGNISGISNAATATTLDKVPPSGIANLAAVALSAPALVRLTWNMPGDDGAAGQFISGSSFTVQFTSNPAFSTWSATSTQPSDVYRVVVATSGVSAGQPVAYILSGLTSLATHYYRVWMHDEQGNISVVSNAASSYTMGWNTSWALFSDHYSRAANWGDYDNDGDLDFFMQYHHGRAARIYRNEGGGSFLQAWIGSGWPQYPTDAAWADFDNDGDLDMAVANWLYYPSRVYRNDGGNQFNVSWQYPSINMYAYGLSVGDLNNDGYLDMVISYHNSQGIDYLMNDRTGRFSVKWNSGVTAASYATDLGDYDSDGDLDILGGYSNNERIFRNNGDDTFTQVWISGVSDDTRDVDWGDLDSDGDLDFITCNYNQPNTIYRNDGGDLFTIVWSSTETDRSLSLALADYDNDGDLDQLVGNFDQPNRIYRNEGSFVFSLVMTSTEADNDTYDVDWSDYDNDGDLDYLVANENAERDLVMKNMMVELGYGANAEPLAPASGFASSVTYTNESNPETITFKWDAGSDGSLPETSLSYQITVSTLPMTLSGDNKRINNPAKFTRVWKLGSSHRGTFLRAPKKVWPGDAVAKYGMLFKPQGLDPNTTYYWRVQTIDGGLAVSDWGAEQSVYVPNTGVPPAAVADLTATSEPEFGTARLSWTAPGDDGSSGALGAGAAFIIEYSTISWIGWHPTNGKPYGMERVVLSTSGVNPTDAQAWVLTGLHSGNTYYFRLWTKDESNNYSEISNGATCQVFTWGRVWTSAQTENTNAVAWGDYDNDGDLDQFAGNWNQPNRVYKNNGSGQFSAVWASPISQQTTSGAWGDYDNDGDLDILIGSQDQPLRIYQNQGFDNFLLVWTSTFTENVQDVAWGDYDNDGDLDFLVGNGNGQQNRLYRNDGGAWFLPVWTSPENDHTYGVAWADFDGDGDLDQLVANYNNNNSRIYRNIGDDSFQIAYNTPELGYAWDGVVGDYDGDGDLDFLIVNYANGWASRLYRNNGGMTFTNVWSSEVYLYARNGSFGDIDNDGDLDIMLSINGLANYNPIAGTLVYKNVGGGNFTRFWEAQESDIEYAINTEDRRGGVFGDADGDGDLDILAGAYGPSNSYYRHYGAEMGLALNAAPSVPASLTSSVTYVADQNPATIMLKWDPATDGALSENTLSYSVVVSTYSMTLGANQTLIQNNNIYVASWVEGSPLMGNYLKPALKTWPGDGGQKRGVYFKPDSVLGGTTYYWRVQSIDAGLRRSSWSAEATCFVPDFTTRPSPIVDLAAVGTANMGEIYLTWTAPGDDGGVGMLTAGSQFIVQYTTDSNFNLWSPHDAYPQGVARVNISTSGVSPGDPQGFLMTDLVKGDTYYFRMWTKDDGASYSDESNAVARQALGWAQVWSGATGNYGDVRWGDSDQDGDLDLMAINYDDNASRLYRFDGGNVFNGIWNGGGSWPYSGSFKDYNNDGYLDLLQSSYHNIFYRLLKNNKNNTFTLVTAPGSSQGARDDDWGDYDNDGDLDLLTGVDTNAYGWSSSLYRNDNGGTLTKVWQAPNYERTIGVAWGDYDNDGDLDMLMGNYGQPNRVYRNDTSTFTSVWTSAETDNTMAVAWGDYDNDGDIDMLVGNTVNQANRIYRNDGGGSFTLIWTSPYLGNTQAVAWGDYDNDGYLDVLFGNSGGTEPSSIFHNDGGATFTRVWQHQIIEQTVSVQWGDYDRDGDLDFAIGNWGTNPPRVFKNNRVELGVLPGNSAPTPPSILASSVSYISDQNPATLTFKWGAGADGALPANSLYYDIAVATLPMNLTGDGKRITSPTYFTVTWDDGSPGLGRQMRHAYKTWPGDAQARYGYQINQNSVQSGNTYYFRVQTIDAGLNRSTWSAQQSIYVPSFFGPPSAVADLNAAAAEISDQLTVTWTSPGNNYMAGTLVAGSSYTIQYTTDTNFNTWSATGTQPSYVYRINIAANGITPFSPRTYQLSSLLKEATYFMRLWTSDEKGNISAISNAATGYTMGWEAIWTGDSGNTIGIDWGDYDNDGDLDQLVGNYGGAKVVRRRSGDTFTSIWTSAETDNTNSVKWGDYDNDGDLDFVAANSLQVSRVYRNNAGSFALVWSSTITTDDTRSAAWGDFDGDGDLDLLMVNYGQPNRIYRNDGNATFLPIWSDGASENSTSAAWADYDHDNDLDFLVGNYNQANRIYKNNGNGTFTAAWSSTELEATNGVSWGDFDKDGDLDQLVGNYQQMTRVYVNTTGAFASGYNIVSTSVYSAAWADYDNDGDLDILVGVSGQSQIYRNMGGSFTQVWASSRSDATRRAVWGDYDNDGDLDILAGNNGLNVVYKSNRADRGLSANSDPAPVTSGFAASYGFALNQSTFTLRWNAADYDGNGTNGLYYEVVVSTVAMTLSGDQKRITAPASFAKSWRSGGHFGDHVRPIYTGGKQQLILRNLPDATYYWRVQVVDGGHARSAWSDEQSFVAVGPSLQVSTTNLATPTIPQGFERAMLKLEMKSGGGGDVVLGSVRVDLSSLASCVDSDVEEIKLYRDNDSDGTLVFGQDVQISQSGAVFSGRTATLTIPGGEQVSVSTKTYFVTLKISQTATLSSTVGVSISSYYWVNAGIARVVDQNFPADSELSTILDSANTLNFMVFSSTASSMPPTNSARGSADVPFMRVSMQTDQGSTDVSGLRLVRTGVGGDADVTAIKIYKDTGNGLWDGSGIDPLVSPIGVSFTAGVSTITFNTTQTITPSLAIYFVMLDVSGAATSLNTIGLSMPTTGAVLLGTLSDTINGAFPISSGQTTVVDPANTMNVSLVNTAPATAFQGQSVSMGSLIAQTNVGEALLTGLRVTLGTGQSVSNVAKVEIYRDANGNGIWGVEDGVALSSAAFSAGAATLNFSSQSVLSSGATFFIVYRASPNAVAASTMTARILLSSDLTLLSPNTTIAGSFPMVSSTTIINPTIDTLTVTPSNPSTPPQSVEGTTGVPMLKLRMSLDANGALWTGLRVDRAGTSVSDADVSGLRIYRDDGDGTFNLGTDTLITSGVDAFSGGTSVISLNTPEPMTVAPAYKEYFVVLDVAQGADLGKTVGLTLANTSYVQLFSPDAASPVNFPVNSNLTEFTEYADIVTMTGTSMSPAGIDPGTDGTLFARIAMRTDYAEAPWTELRVDRTGTLPDGSVKSVKLYKDVDLNGTFSAFTDLLITSGVFSSGTLPMTFPSELVEATTMYYYLVVDISTTSSPNTTLGLRMVSNTYLTVALPNTVSAAGFPFQTSLTNIQEPITQMQVSASSLAPSSSIQGQNNVAMMRLDVRMTGYTGHWTGLRLDRVGTASDTDLTVLKMYRDANANGNIDLGTDPLISSTTFSLASAQLNFTAQVIDSVSTQTYLVAADVASNATPDVNLNLRLASAGSLTLIAPDTAQGNLPMQTSPMTIVGTVDALNVAWSDLSPANVLQGAGPVILMSLVMNTTNHTVTWQGMDLEKTGTIPDSDITRVHLYKDNLSSGTVGSYDSADPDVAFGVPIFTAGRSSIKPEPYPVVGLTPQRYFVGVDINPLATPDSTVGVRLTEAANLMVGSPDVVTNQNFPMQSTLTNVLDNPDTVTVSTLAPAGVTAGLPLGTTIDQGTLDTPVMKLYFKTNQDMGFVRTLRVDLSGTLPEGFITRLSLYRDNGSGNLETSNDTLLSVGLFSGNVANLTISVPEPVTNAGKAYFLSMGIAANAPVDSTVAVRLANSNYVAISTPDVVAVFPVALNSNTFRVRDIRTPVTPVLVDYSDEDTEDMLADNFVANSGKGHYTSSALELNVTWASMVIGGTLKDALYCVGTTPGGSDVRTWTPLPLPIGDYLISGLELQHGLQYYVSVKARSNFDLWSSTGISDGIMVDLEKPSMENSPPTAKVEENGYVLKWTPAQTTISGLKGYVVERRTATKPKWEIVSSTRAAAPSVDPSSITTTATSLVFTSDDPGTYFYRVMAVSGADVLSEPSAEIRVDYKAAFLPDSIVDAGNYPNPFDCNTGATTIVYLLKQSADTKLRIFDGFGNVVKELKYSADTAGGRAGANEVSWDGTTEGGGKVSQGMYIAVLESGGGKKVWKIGVWH